MIPKLSSGALALALTLSHPATPAVGVPDFAAVRSATARFQDVKQAIAEGYVRDPMSQCDTAELMGWSMGTGTVGVHYFRPDLVGMKVPASPRVDGSSSHSDVAKPGILIYEARQDGSLELVAVENLAFKWIWRENGKTEPQKLQGTPFEPMKDNPSTKVDEAQMFEPHYDRNVWILRDNPKGVFAPFDPNASCAARGTSKASAS